MLGGLVIPVAIWGQNPVTHCASSILMTPDQSHIITGCHDGHLCIWQCNEGWKITPQMILFGHASPVTCLAMASSSEEHNYVVSSSDNGDMCLWDLSDGRCLEHSKMSVVHTNIQSHQLLQNKEVRLICNGFYPDILVIHPKRLDVLFTLSSNVQPDWISALCILRPVKQEDDVVVAVTNSGLVKVWTIPTMENMQLGVQIIENESKQTRCLNAKMIKCCIYNQRTVLIICTKYWQIYDASDFLVLCSESSRIGERWIGGEFMSADKVITWSNRGRGYLYQLPSNTNPASSSYRSAEQITPRLSSPVPYLIFDLPCDKPFDCSPVMTYVLRRREGDSKLLLRGDSKGRICVWVVAGSSQDNPFSYSFDGDVRNPKLVKQMSFENLPVMKPTCTVLLSEEWKDTTPKPEGLLDHLNKAVSKVTAAGMAETQATMATTLQVTATVFMSSCCQLVCGRSDGSIIIVSATEAICRQLFESPNGGKPLLHKLLLGHRGRVNCLLYPHNESSRYDPNYLVSGGQDFCVLLWDIFTGVKLFCFCVHGGEILQLLVPPENCNSRVLSSTCAIASDHSLSLLSLRDRKCILLASRQLFPIQVVKWRPHDDFVVIGCTDGTVYVWQMETGHLDRVVHGVAADDVLSACDEKFDALEKLSNPTVTVTQALRRHNMATFKHLAQQHLKKAQDVINEQKASANKAPHPSLIQKTQSLLPMAVQGLRSNPKDSDSHVIYFNTEALIVQLLSEEYVTLSPNTLENLGFYTKVLQDQGLSDTQKMFVDIFSKVKNKADDMSKKIQSKVDTSTKVVQQTGSNQSLASHSSNLSSDSLGRNRPDLPTRLDSQLSGVDQQQGSSSTLLICQILMSCLHAWELDPDVDKLCLSKLGLLKPKRTISFGYLSPGGHMSLALPCAKNHPMAATMPSEKIPQTVQERYVQSSKNPFFQMQEVPVAGECSVEETPKVVDMKIHWQISSAVTTQHLLSIISLTNTLMSMTNATFIKSRQTVRGVSTSSLSSSTNKLSDYEGSSESLAEMNSAHQSQNKQGWSLLAALHCVLLPDLVGKIKFKPPQLEMLARRWQDRCLEIREASQALLLAELRRLGPDGRRAVVAEWSQYLPSQADPSLTFMNPESHPGSQGGVLTSVGTTSYASSSTPGVSAEEDEDEEDDGLLGGNEYLTGHLQGQRPSSQQLLQQHSKQATAIVMMGVIGAEFGAPIEGQRGSDDPSKKSGNIKIDLGIVKEDVIEVCTFVATDADEGNNSIITYSLIKDDLQNLFNISSRNGTLKLKTYNLLDVHSDFFQNSTATINITVWARDGGNPPLWTALKTTVEIKLLESFSMNALRESRDGYFAGQPLRVLGLCGVILAVLLLLLIPIAILIFRLYRKRKMDAKSLRPRYDVKVKNDDASDGGMDESVEESVNFKDPNDNNSNNNKVVAIQLAKTKFHDDEEVRGPQLRYNFSDVSNCSPRKKRKKFGSDKNGSWFPNVLCRKKNSLKEINLEKRDFIYKPSNDLPKKQPIFFKPQLSSDSKDSDKLPDGTLPLPPSPIFTHNYFPRHGGPGLNATVDLDTSTDQECHPNNSYKPNFYPHCDTPAANIEDSYPYSKVSTFFEYQNHSPNRKQEENPGMFRLPESGANSIKNIYS